MKNTIKTLIIIGGLFQGAGAFAAGENFEVNFTSKGQSIDYVVNIANPSVGTCTPTGNKNVACRTPGYNGGPTKLGDVRFTVRNPIDNTMCIFEGRKEGLAGPMAGCPWRDVFTDQHPTGPITVKLP